MLLGHILLSYLLLLDHILLSTLLDHCLLSHLLLSDHGLHIILVRRAFLLNRTLLHKLLFLLMKRRAKAFLLSVLLLLLVMNFLLLILNFLLLVLYLFLMLLMLILNDCLLDTDILFRSILKAFVSSKVHYLVKYYYNLLNLNTRSYNSHCSDFLVFDLKVACEAD